MAGAATVFGLVSERAAPALAEAARSVQAAHPEHRILLRTPAQMQSADDATRAAWLQRADAAFAVAAFGENATQLQHDLDRLPKRLPHTFIALNGDAALSLRSRFGELELRDFKEASTLIQVRDRNQAPPTGTGTHPAAARWQALHKLWQTGGTENYGLFLQALLTPAANVPEAQPEQTMHLRIDDRERTPTAGLLQDGPALAVLDLTTSDPQPADAICAESRRHGLQCAAVMARWGTSTTEAVQGMRKLFSPSRLAGLVVLQDFVVGAAEGRETVTQAFKALDVPVFKAIRITDRSAGAWQLSEEGLPTNSVQYRIAMPEVQGIGQAIVVAVAGKAQLDSVTGVELRPPQVVPEEVSTLVARAKRWHMLRVKPNAEKRVAVIYYNHPPGRQNIGADNLDVPQSLFGILQQLKRDGYNVGQLPDSPAALLDQMQERGINLPEDYGELSRLANKVESLDSPAYARWFAALPAAVRGEMTEGPLGRLHADIVAAQQSGEIGIGHRRLDKAMHELRHLLEGADHPQRERALTLLGQLENGYVACLNTASDCRQLAPLKSRLAALGIEGLRGWGQPPGRVMVHDGRMLFPGLRFGNIFVGPQPPRGWEVDEELLHANTTIPPPHQYLGFYHWLQHEFRADALVHLGRHSTYEFLPGKAVGLTVQDYPRLIAGDLPGIYPYIVDGVGEGTQAKRRGLTVMIDHLTPPLTATPLYDRLLELRQVVESYESSNSESMRIEAAKEMRRLVETLHLRAELEASMADVLKVRGIRYEQADDDLLAHETGHYLTKLQEKFMPHGLHVFGQPWTEASLRLMLDSMAAGKAGVDETTRNNLAESPALEMSSLLHALSGGYIAPGKGNDPLRSPEALPTGRNFHALDGDVLPTRLGFRIGAGMAEKARARDDTRNSKGVILWASDAVRDEGVMVGFILALMGIEPEWDARGIVQRMRLVPSTARHDAIVTTSGLFRDLYPNLVRWIDLGGRIALAASGQTLIQEHPDLAPALQAALTPLGEDMRYGNESLADNGVAANWLRRVRALQQQSMPLQQAGREAAWRIFGDAPGAYGAGVNRLTERSGAWRDRSEIGRAYLQRMGHAYAVDGQGEAAHAAFNTALKELGTTYHGRASNLYGLMDNNDAFDYLGGLSLAVHTLTGRDPEARILNHADPARPTDETLHSALLSELRGRYLNPAWIKPLMDHGYAGARTMGQEFMENLWGWQVTRPDLIKDWVWEEVKQVYVDDSRHLGLDHFLESGHNAQVKAHMLAIMLVAAQKGFWHTSDATLRQLGHQLAQLVTKNGLPGSGHTSPHHPMWKWLETYLGNADKRGLHRTLAEARGENLARTTPQIQAAHSIQAHSTATPPAAKSAPPPAPVTHAYEISLKPPPANLSPYWLAVLLPLFLIGLAVGAGSRKIIPAAGSRQTVSI